MSNITSLDFSATCYGGVDNFSEVGGGGGGGGGGLASRVKFVAGNESFDFCLCNTAYNL